MLTEHQKELVENNHNLIYTFLQKYHLSIDAYYDLAAIGLCKAAETFQESKSSFSTYAFTCMFTTVMLEIRKEKQAKTIPNTKLVYYEADTINHNNESFSLFECLPAKERVEETALSHLYYEEYEKHLKEKEKQVFYLFSLGYKQREIGNKLGCSQSEVSRIKRKMMKYLAS